MNVPDVSDVKSASGPSRRGSINLVVLGSAAVLAIYGAGYLRTRSAAQRFAGDSERRSSAPSVERVAVSADTNAVQHDVSGARPSIAELKGKPTEARAKVATVAPATRDTQIAAPPTPLVQSPSVPPTVRSTDSTPATVIPVPVTPVAPPAGTSSTAQGVDSTAHPADTVRARFKDGTYSGWGTSRHGDIQAAVEIKDGRIAFAYITQCLTRYSCSRIAAIIPQVVTRQSADVDYVSGATQSCDAFYYAVVEALSKAK